MKMDVEAMMRLVPQAVALKTSAVERAAQNAKVLDGLRAKLPGVPIYESCLDGSLLVFRPPTEAEWSHFESFEARGVPAKGACAELVQTCRLYPSENELSEMAQHRPALMQKLALECVKISGMDEGLNFKRAR